MDRIESRNNFIINVEKIRVNLGYTQSVFAEMLEMSISGYRKMIAGETHTISLYSAYLVSELAGISMSEIMGIPNASTGVAQLYNRLSDQQKSFVDTVIRFELEMREKSGESNNYCTLVIPTGEMGDGMDYDSCYYDKIDVGPYGERYKDKLAFALKITSDFFSPVYVEGDILLIGNDRPQRLGEIGLTTCDGKVYLRRFTENNPITLDPITNIGKRIFVPRSEVCRWHKIGYVIKKIRI